MRGSVFTVDGVAYSVTVPEGGLTRQGRVLDGDNTGRVQDGTMVRDIIGTYYNYQIELDTRETERSEYDRLYEVLSAPVNSHTITVPYGQGTITFEAYVSNVDDTLQSMGAGGNQWTGLSFTFTAMEPKRRPA